MARGVRRRHLPASKWGRRRIVLSGPTLPPSISMSGAQSCRRQEACGQVDSRSAPDHFPTGPTTTEAVNSSGTQTGQLHRHQNHTPPKTANTRGSRPSSTLGLVPRQHTTGGKPRLGKISKMGQRDLRRLLITGAMSVVRNAARRGETTDPWLASMLARKPRMLVAVALANRMARITWALTTKKENYRAPGIA